LDSQEDLIKDETVSKDNERLRALVKRYRCRLDSVKKALNSEDYETEKRGNSTK